MDLSAVSSVLKTIGELLTQEVTSLLGVKDQVEDLQTELIWMQSFLRDAVARKVDDEVVRTSVAEVRELAYDAEDIIETFVLKVASKREGGISNNIKRYACILKEGWLLCQTKCEIEKITAKLTKLTERLQRYDVKRSGDGEGSSSSNERLDSRRPYPHIIEDNIVGLDDDIKILVPVLVDEESQSRAVSICGMGGLGKTTLAKKIYRHSQVIGHFNHLALVYVSQQFHKRKVWEDILSGLKFLDNEDRKKRDEDLAEKLFHILEENKCLVILDDIWSIDAWDSLKPAFPARDTRSKILLTSRHKEVATYADCRGYLHELKCLKEEESWELFQKTAFPDRDISPDDERMEELGKNMVKHCAGLPLAIIVLGGILATKYSLNEWQMVFENVKSYLKKGGKGLGTEAVLALSYDDLPPYLRHCFLYLSHFPEDYEIDAKRLIQLWVAEGIVSSKQEEGNGGEIAEHVAEIYLIELVERCMIQVREREVATLKIKTFQMHDLMREFCLSKAKQENFLFMGKSIPYPHGNNGGSPTISRVRRVATQDFLGIQRFKSPHLRSLLIFDDFIFAEEFLLRSMPMRIFNSYFKNHEYDDCNPLVRILLILQLCIASLKVRRIWTYVSNNFKLLRVLDFEGIDSVRRWELSSDIGNLIHLRFLSLRGFTFFSSKLPSSLGNLRCLQTLDLRVKRKGFESVRVPNVIWRMKQLRHLYLPERCKRKPKLKLGTLRNLQTLVNFSTWSCYVEDLLNMTNLSELKIRLPFNVKDFKEDLEKNSPILASKYLRSLSITTSEYHVEIDPRYLAYLLSSCVNICELSSNVKIGKLPEYHDFSSSIDYIHFEWSHLEEDPMPTLGKLRNLRILELYDYAFIGRGMVCSAQSFPRLDSLSLNQLYRLEEWKVEEGAMPALRHLKIHSCWELKKLPDGLRFITALQELKIELMGKAFKDNVVVEGGEDFYKVQHVPSIIFQNCDE